jgi:general secretion pathway protein J
MRASERAKSGGFTLIEILVALLILGIMTALGYETYRAARLSAQGSEDALKRSRDIEFGMRMMVMDFQQIVPRPVRDSLGQSRVPALHGFSGNGTSAGTANSTFGSSATVGSSSTLGSSSSMQFNSDPDFVTQHFNSDPAFQSGSSSTTIALAELSRAGWSNTAGQQRGTLQRVSYALVDDVLKRAYTTNLDIVQGTKPQIQNLFDNVKTVQLRYLDVNQTWQNQWPPPNVPSPENLWMRPVAVEITIELKDWGRIRRLIEVAG